MRTLTRIVRCLVLLCAPAASGQAWIAPTPPAAAGPVPNWVWAEGDPEPTPRNAPSGKIWLSREFEAPAGATLRFAGAADNRAAVFLNGEPLVTASSWSGPIFATRGLRAGRNVIAIEATNDAGAGVNPAGVIARGEIITEAGTSWLVTDGSWSASSARWDGFPGAASAGVARAVVLGECGIAPWSLSVGSFGATAPCPMLRRVFTLAAAPTRARVRVIGLGHYELRCNGRVVGDTLINQAWSQYDKTLFWQEFDLAPHLRVGENVIGVTLGNSFWRVDAPNDAGRFCKTDAMPDFSNGWPHLLWLDGVVGTLAGDVRITSDESWTWAPGPLTFSHIYAGEDYDARLARPGWDAPIAANIGDWAPVVVAPAPGAALAPLTAPGMRAFEVFAPTSVQRPEPGVFTYVFPQNCSQVLRFTLRGGSAGSRVRFRPCEYMDPRGRVKFTYTWGTGKDIWHDYTKASAGEESHQVLFCYVGSQFVQVEGAVPAGEANPDGLPEVVVLEQVHVRADCPRVGEIATSSEMHNAAHTMIDWAIRSNMAHVPTDCPHREKNGWLEQDWHMARAISYRYDIRGWFGKTCRDMRDAQTTDGHIPTNAPNYLVGIPPHGYWNNSCEWGISGVLVPWHLYEWYGDPTPLAESFESAKRYVDFLSRSAVDGVITSNLGDWYDFGHGKGNGPSQWTPNEVSATAIWALGAKTLSRSARVLKRDDDAAKYQVLFEQIRADFQRRFFNPGTHTVLHRGSCQAGTSAALCIGLIPDADRGAALDAVVADLEKRGWAQTPGEVLQIFLIRALAEGGRTDVLHRIYNRTDIPSYGHMVKSGLTTLPESWDARRGTGDSLNHFMLGHLVEWHYAIVAGIRQREGASGWKDIVIEPRPPSPEMLAADANAIRSCDASFKSPAGVVVARWGVRDGVFSLECVVPNGVAARAVLPDGSVTPLPAGNSSLTCPYRSVSGSNPP